MHTKSWLATSAWTTSSWLIGATVFFYAATSSAQTDQQRQTAAEDAAASSACQDSSRNPLNFYWEIGDQNGRRGYGSVGSSPPTQTDVLYIASAGKWLYGAYVAEIRSGSLDSQLDVPFLTMKMGYESMNTSLCTLLDTVNTCFTRLSNNNQNSNDKTVFNAGGSVQQYGSFYYNPGNLQAHAVNVMGLGSKGRNPLADAVNAALFGNPLPSGVTGVSYYVPSLGGGAKIDAADYALFLQKILSGALKMHDLLDADAVCANLASNPNTGLPYCDISSDPSDMNPNKVSAASGSVPMDPGNTLLPSNYLDWQYSIAHWIEPDPNNYAGDGAYSSPGAKGFYPWIDKTKTWYGIIARSDTTGETAAEQSINCGRAIRQAWLTGRYP
ncbi:MAG: hypothetical protein IRZ06_11475 [Nevskia sp.]|nr:hypothetical protein [Nevskia sp.]